MPVDDGAEDVEGEDLRLLSFSNAKAGWELTLRDRMGSHAKSVRDLAQELDHTNFALEGQNFPAVRYGFKAMIPGDWTLSVASTTGGEGFVLVEGAGKTRLMAHQTSFNQQVGKRLGFAASVYDEEGGDSAPQIAEAKLRVRGPHGVVKYPMFDDGLHGDGKALDGLFGADFAPTAAGEFTAQVFATGRAADGKGFIRQRPIRTRSSRSTAGSTRSSATSRPRARVRSSRRPSSSFISGPV